MATRPPRFPARLLQSREDQLLRFVHGHLQAKGYGPSLREMAAGMGTASLRQISTLLGTLERRGFVRRLPRRARAIEVLIAPSIPRTPDGAPLFCVPKLRRAKH